jgi:hypothetical protein
LVIASVTVRTQGLFIASVSAGHCDKSVTTVIVLLAAYPALERSDKNRLSATEANSADFFARRNMVIVIPPLKDCKKIP